MYINPFWLGVITTVFAEVVALVVYALIHAGKGRCDLMPLDVVAEIMGAMLLIVSQSSKRMVI